MTTITTTRALLEQALNALTYKGHFPWADKEHFIDALRAELAKPRLDQAETNKRLQALADSEGTRAVEYLRRARKAEAEIEQLRKDAERMREALTFYAEGDHFAFDRDAWDTVSDEPQNYWCDEAGTATVEDGTIAKLALDAGRSKDKEGGTP